MLDPGQMKNLFRCLITTTAVAAWLSTDVVAVDYRVIAEQNLFDPQRKPWGELEPRAAPVATPSPEEIQVLGVVLVGGLKRAIVKLGGRMRQFAPGAPGGRGNAVLSEGQSVGGYTLETVEPNQVVFASGSNRFTIRITRSAQRDAGPPAPLASVIQAPTTPIFEPPPQPGAPPAPPRAPGQFPPSAQFPQPPAASAPPAGAPAAGSATPPTVAGGGQVPVPQAPATAPAPTQAGMTLLQAIQAAEAARRAGQVQTPPVNPFLPRQ